MATQCEFGVLMTGGFVWEPPLPGVAGVPSSTHESIVPVYKLCYVLSVLWAGCRDSRISPVADVTWGPWVSRSSFSRLRLVLGFWLGPYQCPCKTLQWILVCTNPCLCKHGRLKCILGRLSLPPAALRFLIYYWLGGINSVRSLEEERSRVLHYRNIFSFWIYRNIPVTSYHLETNQASSKLRPLQVPANPHRIPAALTRCLVYLIISNSLQVFLSEVIKTTWDGFLAYRDSPTPVVNDSSSHVHSSSCKR